MAPKEGKPKTKYERRRLGDLLARMAAIEMKSVRQDERAKHQKAIKQKDGEKLPT